MILKNFWYVADLSSAITNKPKRITMLEQDFVLYRDTKGKVVAFNNLCAHRGGALVDGKVEGDCIRCPYHGWKYQPDGACVEIPGNPSHFSIPNKARVDAYPVREKCGWVWLFLGDLPETERPSLPPLPEFDSSGWRAVRGKFKWNAPYSRVVENNLDIAHLPFVHGFERQILEPSDVRLSDWSGSISVDLKPKPSKGLWKSFARHKNGPPVRTTATFYIPSVTRQDIYLPNKSRLILFGVHVPIDRNTTLTWWMQLRNFLTYAWADKDARRRSLKAISEDQRVVEAQRPEMLTYNLVTQSDALQVAYHKLIQKCLDRGWGIDRHQMNSGDSDLETVIIPSPVPQQVPEIAKAR